MPLLITTQETCAVWKKPAFTGGNACHNQGQENDTQSGQGHSAGGGLLCDAMGKLEQYGLVDVIHETVDQGTPFLGICLGLQLLFAGSEECQGAAGLGILPGKILKIPEHPGLKIPHMGWNSLKKRPEAKLFRGIEDGSYVYFVHSYYLKAEDESIVAASTEYGTVIHASVERENVFACQFHPEKSGEVGLAILKNFIGL